ncbi:MAG TPA: hypothetical protein VGG74_04045 [Kofleriaceae bacterium]
MSTSRVAACSCGQLRIEEHGEPLGVGVCHCLARQRRTGSVFATVAAFVAMLAACNSAPPPVAPMPPPPADAPATTGIAPENTAGLYWVPYVTCDDCAVPQAIAAYLTPDEHVARAIRAALDGKLALGLPYLVHTDELGVAPRAIAVVIGAFGSRDAAARAASASPVVAGVQARAIAIDAKASPAEAPRHVTVVDRGGPVQAWSKADVDAAKQSADGHDAVIAALAPRPAACSVLPGDVFVVEDGDVDWYELAPVRCGGELAYIDWTKSLLGHAVIVRNGGAQTLTQIVGAECDTPSLKTWRYDADGRHDDAPHAPHAAPLAKGGC